jgi:hypothetical protein
MKKSIPNSWQNSILGGFTEDIRIYIYILKIPNITQRNIMFIDGFKCVEYYFCYINWKYGNLEQTDRYTILSFNTLWGIALTVENQEVSDAATVMLIQLQRCLSADLESEIGPQREEFLNKSSISIVLVEKLLQITCTVAKLNHQHSHPSNFVQ